MSEPVAQRVLDAVGEAFRARAGAATEPLVTGLVTGLQDVSDLSDPGDHPWSDAFDLDATPAPRWLGAVTGTPMPMGLTAAQARATVRDRSTWQRGTPAALLAAARSAYTRGHIELLERNGSAWKATLRVYGATNLELEQVRVAAAAQKPVGIVLTVEAAVGATYAHLSAVHGTYAELAAEFPTYDAMTSHQPEGGV